ncbi:MAG: hypothetical protein CMN58_01075 [Solibacterales bacterium]|nr:hypothetical protein [Bryobacterales bacterium]
MRSPIFARRNFLQSAMGGVAALSLATCKNNSSLSKINFEAIRSPILFKGDAVTAFRDPTVVYDGGIFWLYYSYVLHELDGRGYNYTAYSTSSDLVNWTDPHIFTPRDERLNYCAPGNVIRYEGEWILCLQTYPRPNFQRGGNEDCRIWIRRSKNLADWGEPELLKVRGPEVAFEDMGRIIDPYLIQDKHEPEKWWCFFDDNAVNMSFSYDLNTWTYFDRIPGGENVCVLTEGRDDYLMFHSINGHGGNGIAMKRSRDLKAWEDTGSLITLGQQGWPWAQGRITAGFVLDLREELSVGKYLMFFHGTGPEDESVIFNTHACLGIAWSDDLVTWDWPGKGASIVAM